MENIGVRQPGGGKSSIGMLGDRRASGSKNSSPLKTSISLPIVPESSAPKFSLSETMQATNSGSSLEDGSSSDPIDSRETGTFYQRLRIDVKEPVGNMSISPANRDICLGARKGLFIIDLENPHDVPRFMPQGGTWEVADVQWNPHPARSNLIVSTSSQKLLIWNLYLSGQTAIEHILHAHYRAITDVNWHPHIPDVVASCGIDSWIWVWDLRAGRRANVLGLSAWNAGATQVKWNRQDSHILASSHDASVLIWDDRKGSLPLLTIPAHDAKIYGIDWSRKDRNEIVTCSLDKTIKFWKIDSLTHEDDISSSSSSQTPSHEIHLSYPVWRARHTPFGDGILTLPQRGYTGLELWSSKEHSAPIWKYEGHTDVVKEYVWRSRGGDDPNFDDRQFQLVTWSKDRTLRLWPVESSILEKTGFEHGSPIKVLMSRRGAPNISYRTLPEPQDTQREPTLSAPKASRGILAGIRALPAPRPSPNQTPSSQSQKGTPPSGGSGARSPAKGPPSALPPRFTTSTYMTRGHQSGKTQRMRLDQTRWFSRVKVEQRDSSAGPGGSGDSGPTSRVNSMSRAPSIEPGGRSARRDRSASRDTSVESDVPRDLADEISTLTRKLPQQVKLEKVDIQKKRMATFSLYGPWGESTQAFVRITFEFPKDYLKSSSPSSMPSIDLERSTQIPLKTRAFLLRNLRSIRDRRRPCVEACLHFLLGWPDKDGFVFSGPMHLDSDSSDEDEELAKERTERDAALVVFRNNQNTPRPRSCQGVFGPNGELVCFFTPTTSRVFRSRTNTSPSPSINSRTTGGSENGRIFSGPATLTSALRGLSKLARDDTNVPSEHPGRQRMRFSDNIFTPEALRSRTQGSGKSSDILDKPWVRVPPPPPKSYITIKDCNHLEAVDRAIAEDYAIMAQDPASLCQENAGVARTHGRYDHERVWTMLHALLTNDAAPQQKQDGSNPDEKYADAVPVIRWGNNPLASRIINAIFEEFRRLKDVQMLAMLSAITLEVERMSSKRKSSKETPQISSPTSPSRLSIDYFSLRPRPAEADTPSPSTPWPRLHSLIGSPTPNPPSSATSKASWTTSILTAGRFLLAGTNDGNTKQPENERNRVTSPSEPSAPRSIPGASALQQLGADVFRKPSLFSRPDSPISTTPKPLSEPGPSSASGKLNVTFSSAGQRRKRLSIIHSAPPKPIATKPKQVHARYLDEETKPLVNSSSSPDSHVYLQAHIIAYAEILFRWELLQKRSELLKSVPASARQMDMEQIENLVIEPLCSHCLTELKVSRKKLGPCPKCKRQTLKNRCTVCHVPVKGLGHTCLTCCHVTHVTCWTKTRDGLKSCPSGCGCDCKNSGAFVLGPSSGTPNSPRLGPLSTTQR